MKRLVKGFLAFCIVMQLFGCAGLRGDRSVKTPLSDQCQAKALAYKKAGELQKALYHLEIAGKLNPGDEQIDQMITDLKADMAAGSAEHFKRGIALYKEGSFKAARKEFMMTLRYDPHHRKALDYLKNRSAGESSVIYRVKLGDTAESIAFEVYRNPEMDFLVAGLMGLGVEEKPLVGSVVRFPILKQDLTGPSINVKAKLSEALSFFKAKEYQKVLPAVQEVLDYHPENKEAVDLKNVSFFRMGKRLVLKRKYPESLAMFNKVDPGYKGVQEAISDVKDNISKQAEAHYKRGIKFFLKEDLKSAMAEWEKTLILKPEHQKAKQGIEEAGQLLEKLKQVE